MAAVKVRKTGERDMRTRNIIIDDFITFKSRNFLTMKLHSFYIRAGHTIYDAILLAGKRIPGGIADEKQDHGEPNHGTGI